MKGALPDDKYSGASYEGLAHLVGALCGDEDLLEFVRRVVFVILSGNTDAHLKNWSLIYPDTRTARNESPTAHSLVWPPMATAQPSGWSF